MSRFALSTWTLDGMLQAGLPLLELPPLLAQHDIHTLELCHFHLPGTQPAYLQEFRRALQASQVELYSLLIDTGDIATPDPAQLEADLETTRHWIEVAAALGAGRVRIAAGRQEPTPAVVQQSARELLALAQYAAKQGLPTITENWLRTSQEADVLLAILDQCEGQVGLCADTGNANATADKYATLAQLLPRASSIHFKAGYTADGAVEPGDLQRCIQLIQQAQFAGVITLIYDGKKNEWEGVDRLRQALQPLV